jgi:two-component system CheB/CheR fusion protein
MEYDLYQNFNRTTPWCVGIGASAGGVEALEAFFKSFPVEKINASFIVVQHLSPTHKSHMRELLSRNTSMNVRLAGDGMEVRENSVYVLPPGNNLRIFNGKLYLEPQKSIEERDNLPIDVFFRSLAKDKKHRAVGIILSGTGSDGTLGVKVIKEQDGMAMVQNPGNAKFDGMPKNAIETGMADYALPVSELPHALMNFINHSHKINFKKEDLVETENNFSKILALIREKTSVDFSLYKPATILRRLEKRRIISQKENLESYLSFLRQDAGEIRHLFQDMLIGVTRFFRDSQAFEKLEADIVLSRISKLSNIRWVRTRAFSKERYPVAITES